MDFDPRDFDSRDGERLAPTRDRDDRGAVGRDNDRGDDGSRSTADPRDRGRWNGPRPTARGFPRCCIRERYRDARKDLRWPERNRYDRAPDIDSRDVFTRNLDLPRGPECERVWDRRPPNIPCA